MKISVILSILIFPTLFVGGCTRINSGAPAVAPMPVTDPQVKLGQQVFFEHCQQCHPSAESGIGPGIVDKPLPDGIIRFQVRHGIGQMPAFSEKIIDDTELTALIEYLNALRNYRSAKEKG